MFVQCLLYRDANARIRGDDPRVLDIDQSLECGICGDVIVVHNIWNEEMKKWNDA